MLLCTFLQTPLPYVYSVTDGASLKMYMHTHQWAQWCQWAMMTVFLPSSDSLSESWLMMSFLCSRACSRAAWSLRGNREASSSICVHSIEINLRHYIWFWHFCCVSAFHVCQHCGRSQILKTTRIQLWLLEMYTSQMAPGPWDSLSILCLCTNLSDEAICS